MNKHVLWLALTALTLTSSTAFALPSDDDDSDSLLLDGDGFTPWAEREAFDRNFAIGIYGVGWGGG